MKTKELIENGADYITSRSNRRAVLYASLDDRKNRDKTGLFLAEGVKLTGEALRFADCEDILISEEAEEIGGKLEERLLEGKTHVTVLAGSVFEKISTERAPQGIIAVVRKPQNSSPALEEWQRDRRIMMLDEIRDPGNLGTIMRSAEALGNVSLVLCGCADPYGTKTVRAAMGTLFRLPVFTVTDGAEAVRILKKCGRNVYGAALGEHTLTLGEYETKENDVIVIGNEGHGISDDILRECSACVRIPMSGMTESLNAASAAVCFLWEYKRIQEKNPSL